ncbi:MAG: PspA/IM30 family protein [Planctomycetes bacterium]|nr:PspA/IM30 family protein [Planctomycetota bacterium]
MWARIKRAFRAFFGGLVGAMENPKAILEQNIRDMHDRVPEMNNGIAKARGGIVRLENEAEEYNREIVRLRARVKACLLANEEGMAGQFAVELKRAQDGLERNAQQLESSRAGYKSLLALKENYMKEMKRKTDEAMRAIREAEAAKWKSELADVFEQFEVAGVDATHDEMVQKLRGQAADAEGRLLMAHESVDMKSIVIERKAQELEGQELLKQFKIELGLAEAEPVAEAPRTIGPAKENNGFAPVAMKDPTKKAAQPEPERVRVE